MHAHAYKALVVDCIHLLYIGSSWMQHSTGSVQCRTSVHNQCKTTNQKSNVRTKPQTLSLFATCSVFLSCSQEMGKMIAEAGGKGVSLHLQLLK